MWYRKKENTNKMHLITSQSPYRNTPLKKDTLLPSILLSKDEGGSFKCLPMLKQPCKDKLKHLNLHSLERRRIRGDLIEMFKWVKGFNKGNINKVLLVKEKVKTRTNGFKLDKFRYWKDVGKNWFTNRVVEEWNKLSKHVVSVRTVYTLEKRLDISMDEENRW